MEAWAREFLDLWQARKHNIAAIVLRAVEQNPYIEIKDYTLEDMIQIFEGFIAMIREALEGKNTEIRDTYMNSVIPGFLAQGLPLSSFVGQVTMNAILVYNELVPLASPEHRETISTWLTNWYVKFNMDIVRIGVEYNTSASAQ